MGLAGVGETATVQMMIGGAIVITTLAIYVIYIIGTEEIAS